MKPLARNIFALSCLFLISTSSSESIESNSIDDEEPNPFLDAAKSFFTNLENNPEAGGAGLAALQGLLQSDAGKQIGNLLGSRNVQGNENPTADILSGLANMFMNSQQNGENSAAPNFDISQIIELLGTVTQSPKNSEENGADTAAESSGENSGIDWNAMLGLASNFISNAKNSKEGEGGGGMEQLLNLLPLLTSGFSNNHVHFADSELEDTNEHKKHEKSTSFLPPFLGHLYEYWEHFKKSELGHTLWNKSGLEGIFQLFTDKDGYFQVDRIFESMENMSFRRKWIKSLSSFVAGWIKHLSDPETQTRYLTNAQFIGNGFLKAQGYPKATQFDATRPAESLSFLIDAVFKRQFGLKINSYTYIKPALAYIQDVFKMGQSKGLSVSHLSSQEISNKLAEVINGDVLEPVLRVWRAYRYAIKNPQCDRYLMCTLNTKDQRPETKTGLKPGVTKISSLIASWYLSGRSGTPFWKLYNASSEDHNCKTKYPADCQQFHEEEIKVTTEYAHNEL